MQRPKLFAVMAGAIMSISPIPSRIRSSVAKEKKKKVRNTNTHTNAPLPTPPCQVRSDAALVLGVFCRLSTEKSQRGKRDVLA